MFKGVGVCIRAWEYVSERGSIYNSFELCISVEACVRAWKYIKELGSMCQSVKVCIRA